MIDHAILTIVRDRDPDGHETRPTEDAYVAFRRWVINTFGLKIWHAYTMGH